MKANDKITPADCTKKCDAVFELLDNGDEATTDKVCQHLCECEINKTPCDKGWNKPTTQ